MKPREGVVSLYSFRGPVSYPSPPFHPSEPYPEYPFGAISRETNEVYQGVRQLFYRLGLDRERFGTQAWNPLGELIQPGERVLLKPNLVKHVHAWGLDVRSIVTHGSVIRAVLDYVWIATKGQATIVIGDAPLQYTDFDRVCEIVGLPAIVAFYRATTGCEIPVKDFRREITVRDENHICYHRVLREGDDRYYVVDLGQHSLLQPISDDYTRYRVTRYNVAEMQRHHNKEVNEYLVPSSVIEADVVINLPKLKTHRKVGITACLKNLVGINGNKDWLPHHRCGSKEEGFDEYLYKNRSKALATWLTEIQDTTCSVTGQKLLRLPRAVALKLAKLLQRDPFLEGSWYGNDTAWRMVLDLNRLLLYAGRNGEMTNQPQRRYFSVVDAVIAGEAEGPLEPTPKYCGVLTAGFNPLVMDVVHVTLMGFDYRKIPLLANAFDVTPYPITGAQPEDICIVAEGEFGLRGLAQRLNYQFVPPAGWQGHIERDF